MTPYKILILDDESIIRNHLKNLLTDNGYQVTDAVRTKEEAIVAITARPPDLALLDIQLSDTDIRGGIEAAIYIMENNYSFPFIFLTGHDENFDDALKTNPGDYISKLDRDEAILQSLALVLKKHYSDKASYSNVDFGATHIFVKTKEGKVKIDHNNIYFVKADNMHMSVVTNLYDKKPVTKGKFLVSSTKLEIFDKHLPKPRPYKNGFNYFLKTGRSYLINIKFVTGYDSESGKGKKYVIINEKHKIQITKDRLKELISLLEK